MQRLERALWLQTVFSVLLISCWSLPSIMAQGVDTALLRGTVLDSSGGVIPGASVTITNQGTGVSENKTTDTVGRYIFNALKPAVYSVRVEAPGFKTLIQNNIDLRVGQQSDLDLTLQVGNAKETVEVSAATPLLNTVRRSGN